MRYFATIARLFILIAMSSAHAFEGGVFMDCKPTPTIEAWHFPNKPFNTSANLLRKSGHVRRAEGEYILIKGKILDSQCVPVQNAVVHIWQPDNNGLYEQSYPKIDHRDIGTPPGADRNFGYTGTARTDNFGNFAFLTIFPGRFRDNAPYVNYLVQHQDFEELASRIYFARHPSNYDDPDFKILTEEEQKLVTADGRPIDPSHRMEGREYQMVITLDGANKYTRY